MVQITRLWQTGLSPGAFPWPCPIRELSADAPGIRQPHGSPGRHRSTAAPNAEPRGVSLTLYRVQRGVSPSSPCTANHFGGKKWVKQHRLALFKLGAPGSSPAHPAVCPSEHRSMGPRCRGSPSPFPHRGAGAWGHCPCLQTPAFGHTRAAGRLLGAPGSVMLG